MEIIYKATKKADLARNRIVIPKFIIDKYGYYFILEVYDDGSIIIKPMKSKEGE